MPCGLYQLFFRKPTIDLIYMLPLKKHHNVKISVSPLENVVHQCISVSFVTLVFIYYKHQNLFT